jgi:uncharacterized ferritin-like protein (DUF455 family)
VTRDEDTVERWARDYIESTSLAHKLAPPPLPSHFAERPSAMRIAAPGRPRELDVRARAKKTRGLAGAEGRARAFATFLHHELQAAELMAWAILAFPETPRAFRRGLARIAEDETRHMRMYAEHIERLGFGVGDFPVRDWFWERVPASRDARAFVAVMGLGLESANLEHAEIFARKFREAGDEVGACVQERVACEEIAHVRFGVRWFVRFESGALRFDAWERALPPPLSPMMMRGAPINRAARLRAGQPNDFIDELDAWTPGY